MICPRCQHENLERAKFCAMCGAKLERKCPSCRSPNPPGSAFCIECGHRLTSQEAPAPSPTPVRAISAEHIAPGAERRQLTVMFCDLVGSTALSEQLDPEELRELVRSYQEVSAKVIQRFEGHIAQYLGDGLLVYFGYPRAHEDDAQRAVRTGLEIVGAIGGLNTRLVGATPSTSSGQALRGCPTGVRLAVRVGIHTGLVVVGEMGGGDKHEQLALGETPNIAARVQGIAEPDTVVISAATYRLIQGLFVCQSLGFKTLKGLTQPMAVYRVLQESGVQSRFEVAVTTGLTPLVGREQEVGLLLARWAQVKDGVGQVVLLSGEPGIGKSRLVKVLKEYLMDEPHSLSEVRCSPYYQNSALYPIIDLLQRALQFHQDEAPEAKLEKLEQYLGQYGIFLPEGVPLLASLLSVPLGERYAPLSLSPQRQKQKTLEALLAVLLAIAEKRPVLFIVENLHWIDPSTLELLSLVIDQAATARIFTLLTFRPEFCPPWAPHSYLTQITLTRLDREQGEEMVRRITGGKGLPGEVLQQVVAKTDGVPLFVEELTKMVLESGLLREREGHYELTGPLPPLAIPSTLHDSLMARLDRLATVKEVAQLGAALGREFPYELLQAVSPLDEATLQHALGRLVDAELLYQRGLPPQGTYLFKHALIQEAAYQSLLKSKRQQYHQRIAQVLEERFPETAQTQPELLAHHYTEAGLREQAILYCHRAGQRAIQRSANVEAIGHLTKGLELLKTLPDTPERTQRELMLQIALGAPLVMTKGYAAPEVASAYARARELCQQVGETPQLFPVLRGLWVFYLVRAELRTAHELGKQLLTLAQSVQDRALLLEAHLALGATLSWLGELAPAKAHSEQGISLYDPQQHRSHAFLYGHDPGVVCLSYAARVLWALGYPDQALERSHAALTLAQELAHPHSLASALTFAAMLHQFRREGQAAQERTEAAITLSIEQGFALWVAAGTVLQGWALAEQGQVEEGIAQIRQGLAAVRATGAQLTRPYLLALLAEAYGKVGQTEARPERSRREGLTVLAEALAAAHKNGERFYEAELYRIKGELLLSRGAEENITPAPPHPCTLASPEACFHQAINIARRQSAKSLELRAVVSMSRLWQQQGKRDEARKLLAEIYGWFTEGFDTADLKEAKALLEALS